MNFLQLFFCATLAFATNHASPTVGIPVFHTSTDLTNYVKNSLMQDLETINLLDREMATPVRKTKKANRKLRKRTQIDPLLLARMSETHHRPVNPKFSKLNSPRQLSPSLGPLTIDFDDSEYETKTLNALSEMGGDGKTTCELIRQH